jgi:AraC-like DNA-binding protein
MVNEPRRLVSTGMCLWPAALIVWGPGLAWSNHAHECVQLTVALRGALRVRERTRTPWRRGRAVVVKAHVQHEIDASGAFVLMAFVEPASVPGVAVTAHLRAPVEIVSNGEVVRWRRALGDPKALDSTRVRKWVTSTLMRNSISAGVDRRVEHVIRMLRERPLDTRATSLTQLSRLAGLSPSRFAHVFTESMGVPVRPYMRWLRLQRAARELVTGHSVTHAAHVAGFADAAHLTRTVRRMVGATPRDLVERARVSRQRAVPRPSLKHPKKKEKSDDDA